jgi:hypothetical protein
MPTLIDLIPRSLRESQARFFVTETLRDWRGRCTIARARHERIAAAGKPPRPTPECATIAATLERDGLAVIPAAVPTGLIDPLYAELEHLLDTGSRLNRVSNDRARARGDERASSSFLSDDQVALGQTVFRDLTNYASVRQPFVDCPSAVPLAFLPICEGIATAYLEAPPAVGGANLRKSFVNDIPEFDTLLFHVDPNSPKFLKFFFYLHDVGPGGGGFCYVRGSHRRRFRGWTRKYRWTRAELLEHYPESGFVEVHAKKGYLIVADTNGFHAGTKATAADRSMLTVDYLLHRDFYAGAELRLRTDDFSAVRNAAPTALTFLKIGD